jgi:uridylate kinase
MINGLALTDIFEDQGIKTRCLSNIYAEQVAEPFVYRLAMKHLQAGRVIIVVGGIGRPYLTTDTAAIDLALELDCQAVLKATKVDGVYNQDPAKFPDAKNFDHLNYQQAVEDGAIRVMDKAALGLAMEYQMPVIVFNAEKSGNILDVVNGQVVGTTIS